MCNVLKFFGAIFGFLFLAMVGMSYAQELGCYDPPAPVCPPVNVTCTCECGEVWILPGLWEIKIGGKRLCGTIEIGGGAAMINGQFLSLNQANKANEVEACE